jgi:predicted DNA-binding transcriptional regulator AlpA
MRSPDSARPPQPEGLARAGGHAGQRDDLSVTPQPRLLKRREAARMLGISERLLWTLSSSGKVPVVRLGRRVLYDVRRLEALIARGGVR